MRVYLFQFVSYSAGSSRGWPFPYASQAQCGLLWKCLLHAFGCFLSSFSKRWSWVDHVVAPVRQCSSVFLYPYASQAQCGFLGICLLHAFGCFLSSFAERWRWGCRRVLFSHWMFGYKTPLHSLISPPHSSPFPSIITSLLASQYKIIKIIITLTRRTLFKFIQNHNYYHIKS